MRPTPSERGSASLEVVIGLPAFLLFLLMIIAAGRVSIAHQSVEAAATEAVRSASISRTQPAARSAATASAGASLANQNLRCLSQGVSVDTAGFAAAVGTPGQVSATVTCVVGLSDVALPGLPGSTTITATMSSPLDTYRER